MNRVPLNGNWSVPGSASGARGIIRRFLCAVCSLIAMLTGTAILGEFITPPSSQPSARTRRVVTKSIEAIRVDDVVLAWDEETDTVAPKKVTAVYRHRADHVRVVMIRSCGTDRSQELTTTDDHPFFVMGRGWVKAAALKTGDKLRQHDGEYAQVEACVRHEREQGMPVYNIETEGFHTYFVAEHGARGPPILVHNCNNPKPGAIPNAKGANPVQANAKGAGAKGAVPANPGLPPTKGTAPNRPQPMVGRRAQPGIGENGPVWNGNEAEWANSPLQPVRNSPATINGRQFSGHAIDQMQNRGIPPSVVENTIQHGTPFAGNRAGTQGFYDPVNRVRVIINSDNGTVVTVIPGGG